MPVINQSGKDRYSSLDSGRRMDKMFYQEAMNSDIHPYGLSDTGGRTARHLAKNKSLVNPITGQPYQRPEYASS